MALRDDIGITGRVQGLPDIKAALAGIAPKLRLRALRNALSAGARVVRNAARKATPVMNPLAPGNRYAFRKGYRKPRTVQQALSVRTSKLARRRGDVGVFVNVRPVKGVARGSRSAKDPFYWRFLNWGWNPATSADGQGAAGQRARRRLNTAGAAKRRMGWRFLEAGAARLPEALQIFLQRIGPAIAKLNKPKDPAP
jgi:HK97 gp10 family phage protein